MSTHYNEACNTKASTTATPTFSILTYNIWFNGGFGEPKGPSDTLTQSQNDFVTRMHHIVKILVDSDADVICLQEVTPWSELIFRSNKALASKYYFSRNHIRRYGVLMLSCKAITKSEDAINVHKLTTRMGRDLLSVEVDLPGPATENKILVCTAHFESLSAADLRRRQLMEAAEVMNHSKFSQSILCGDFNFCSYRNFNFREKKLENDVLREVLSDHIDVWPRIHGVEKGYTFDSKRNNNLRKLEQFRYDRILCNLDPSHLEPSAISLIGTSAIGDCLHPSDHFGLLAKFRIWTREQ